MKKIVFFIFLFLIVIPGEVQAKQLVKPCQSGELEVSDDHISEISVVKRGPDPFISVIDNEGGRLYVRDFLCTEDRIIIYGFSHFPDNETYYEGYIVVLDHRGNELKRIIYDYGELEEVMNVVYFDYVYGVVINQQEYTQEPTFMSSFVLILDQDFNELSRYVYDQEVYEVEAKGNLLSLRFLLSKQFNVGIISNLEEIYPNQVFTFDEQYDSPLNISFLNEAYLNNERIENGVIISYPGHYEFIYNGQEYHFTMHPNILGVEDKEVYFEPVTIWVSEGNVLLNNELYINNTIITEPGNYQLKIQGKSGYEEEINFTIGSEIQGLVNGFEYQNPITISFTGQGFLNSNRVTSPFVVDKQGEYVFRVIGENGYSEEYHFNINYEEKFDMIAFIQKIDIFIMVGVVITGVVIIKKSK